MLEVYGLPSEVLAELVSILPNWKLYYSPCFDADGILDPGLFALTYAKLQLTSNKLFWNQVVRTGLISL